MKLTKEELSQLYQEQSARAPQWAAACPSAEELTQVATGEITPEERARITDHLMVCAGCAYEYRLIGSLKPWAVEMAQAYSNPPVPETKAAHWQTATLPPQVKEEPAISRPVWWPRRGLVFAPALFTSALAASLLIAGLALGIWTVWLRRENRQLAAQDQAAAQSLAEARRQLEDAARRAESYETQIAELRRSVNEPTPPPSGLTQPQLNAPIIDLDPRGTVRGPSSGAAKLIELPTNTQLFTWVLNVVGQQSYSNYALEILDERGHRVWQGQGLRKSQDNTFTLALPQSLLPAGKYQIKLYGLSGKQRELVEDYAVEIRYK